MLRGVEMTTGKRIKDLRKKKGLTQTELGEMLGLNYGAISALENDRNSIGDHLIDLCKIFQVSADYIINGREESGLISEDEQEVLELYRNDPKLRESLQAIIDLKKKVISLIRLELINGRWQKAA